MAGKKEIFSLGIEIPGRPVTYIPFTSIRRLLDADIIISRIPDVSTVFAELDIYDLGTNLDNSNYGKYSRMISKWREEIIKSVELGKTIFFFLNPIERATKIYQRMLPNNVEEVFNYNIIPIILNDKKLGTGRKILIKDPKGILEPYENIIKIDPFYYLSFSSVTEKYKTRRISDVREGTWYPTFFTRTGDEQLGGVFSDKKGGFIILLPPIMIKEGWIRGKEGLGRLWSEDAEKFGKRLIKAISEIDKRLRGERTPPPEWVNLGQYRTVKERQLKEELETINTRILSLKGERTGVQSELDKEVNLTRLLYESGTELEEAVREALMILGFENVSNYEGSHFDIDTVFYDSEKTFLGEIVGNNETIHKNKIEQLSMNTAEYERIEDEVGCRGVLFGNAFRLKPLEGREDYFTDACKLSAKTKRIALVRTPDLFRVAKYLKENEDERFEKECKAVFNETTSGIIAFPEPPDYNE